MLDDEQDKQVQRSQVIAFLLMAVLLIVWMNYFMPKPTEQPPADGQGTETTAPQQPIDSGPRDVIPASADDAVEGLLPPVPTPEEIEAAGTVKLDHALLRLEFTPVGGRLLRAELHSERVPFQIVPEELDTPETDLVLPFGLRFSDPAIKDELDRRLWTVDSRAENSVSFSIGLGDRATLRKTFSFDTADHVIKVTITYENLETDARVLGRDDGTPAYILNWGPNLDTPDKKKGVQQAITWREGGTNEALKTAKLEPGQVGPAPSGPPQPLEWIGVKSAYFMAAFRPDTESGARPWFLGDPERFRFGVMTPRIAIEPGTTHTMSYQVYIGPMEMPDLKQAWPTLDTSLRFFEWPALMDSFAKLLLRVMHFFYDNVYANWGVAIILLTVLVRGLMVPLTIKQMRSMKSMSLLGPEMEAIKEKYGDDPQEMNKRMMEMYRERGVNPLGGCFPMLLQMPIFIALYRMLWSAHELYGAPFLWVESLSEPDRLFYFPELADVPYVGRYIQAVNIIPILSIFAMWASTELMPMSGPVQNPQQKIMMRIMPVFFGVICYPFAAGLNLYILVSTTLGILQSRLIRVSAQDVPEKKPQKKKQHFYTAAQKRKREKEREFKKRGKKKPPRA